MEISAVAPSPGSNSFRKHFKNRIVILAREITVGVCTLDESKQFIFIPTGIVLFACRGHPRPRIDFIDLAGFRNKFEFRSRVRRPRRMVGCASRDNLLGQNVQRRFRNRRWTYWPNKLSRLAQPTMRRGRLTRERNSNLFLKPARSMKSIRGRGCPRHAKRTIPVGMKMNCLLSSSVHTRTVISRARITMRFLKCLRKELLPGEGATALISIVIG